MAQDVAEMFVKRMNQYGALFRLHPNAIFENRDHIWRVTAMFGTTPSDIFGTSAFKALQRELRDKNVPFLSVVTPANGYYDIFPKTWVCSGCNLFMSGELESRACHKCGGEFRQFPFVVACNKCGYLGPIRMPREHKGCHSNKHLVLNDQGSNAPADMRLVCGACARQAGIQHPEHMHFDRVKGFRVFSDLDVECTCPGTNCGVGISEGKFVTPATSSTLINPLFTRKFDKEFEDLKEQAVTTLSAELERVGSTNLLEHIKEVFKLREVYLTPITVLSAVYGYKLASSQKQSFFKDGTVFIIAEKVMCATFHFDIDKFPESDTGTILHSIAHSLLNVCGYITGLGNDCFEEYCDEKNGAVMIFSSEGGACDLLVRSPEKMRVLLRRAQALVKGCKNQCNTGCKWCLYVNNRQCNLFNNGLNRAALSKLWKERFLITEE